MFSRDNRGNDLFSNATIDSSNPDKIIIREKEAKRKVRRRVKKGTKDQVIARKQAEKVKIVKTKPVKDKSAKNATPKKSVYDTVSFDVMDLDNELDNVQAGEGYNTYDRSGAGFKLPRLSDIKKSDDFEDIDLSSDFRKSSADWKDASIPDYSGLADLNNDSFAEGFFEGFKSMNAMQWVAFALAVVLFVSSVLTTNVYAKLQCKDNRDEAFAQLARYEDTTFEQVASAVESVEAPISMEEAKPQLGKVLSLVLSSVEKDLKIKLVDEDDTLVKNVPWSVTIADTSGNTSEQADDDQDGIIHMTDVSAGDYAVALNPSDDLADFELPASAQMVSVKAKVEYKVIADIKEEIKSEKEINVAAEDAAGNQAADVETAGAALTDTVEWVESSKTVNGEEYVEATPDISKTASIKSGNILVAMIDEMKANVSSVFSRSGMAYAAILADENEEKPSETDGEGHTSHSYDTFVSSNNDGTHKMKCTGCDETKNVSCNTSGDGGKCSVCDYKAQETHSHDFSGTPSSDGKGKHTYTCKGSDCSETKTEDCDTSGDGGKCSKCGYKAQSQEASISLNKSTLTLTVGGSDTISATVNPSASVTYTSSDTSVATVDGSGKVTAVKAGTATITAKANDKTATCAVTVNAKAEEASISLSGTTTVKVNEKTTITATITPSGKKVNGVSFADSSIAACAVDGNKITVQGLKAGSTKMVVKSDNGKETSVTITVESSEKTYSDDAQIYDASKNALYVKDGDSYRLAKYKDYRKDKNQKFYRKQETYLYTGWQTIDGQKCYFDKNHNKVTGKQIIGGVEYDFGDSGSVSTGSGTLGIDVSKYQPSINWSAVKSSGVDYVIIRCGYRGSSTGVLVEDPYFKSHIKGAKAAGLKVGVYFFTTALTEAEAVEEASMCAYLCNGYGLDFPIFMDCESSPRAGYNGMSASQRTAVIKAFCNTIRSAGYTPGVYANKTWLTSYMHAGELSGYKIWLAQYNAAGPTYSGKYDMWQYTSKGSVNGISGYVDMNKCYYR